MIAKIIQQTGVSLSRRGDKFVGLCPFHPDKDTPSLTVYPMTDSWYCFGCNRGGDALEFVKLKFNYSFPQAKEWIDGSNFEQVELPDLSIKTEPKKHSPQIEHNEILYYHSLMNSTNKRQYWYNRGFIDKTIDTQLLGYNGQGGYIIPIWAGKPQESKCLAYKIRNTDGTKQKYTKIGSLEATIYGSYFCEFAPCILAFAGELDCLAATEDGYPAFSLVNGMNSWKNLPDNWPNKIFHYVEKIITVFDVGEEIVASKLAEQWENSKGKFTAKVFHWPEFEGKDYCDYRQKHNDFDKLIERYL